MASVADVGPNECSLCLGDFDPAHPAVVLHTAANAVDHVFHAACVNPWVQKHHDCPLCREDMSGGMAIGNNVPFNVKFARFAMGKLLSVDTTNYLREKYTRFKYEWDLMDPILWTIQLIRAPIRVLLLTIQTIFDICAALLSTVATVVTLNLHEGCREEMKKRLYNLFIADTLSWLALPVSIIHCGVFNAANALHLGTTRLVPLIDGFSLGR